MNVGVFVFLFDVKGDLFGLVEVGSVDFRLYEVFFKWVDIIGLDLYY